MTALVMDRPKVHPKRATLPRGCIVFDHWSAATLSPPLVPLAHRIRPPLPPAPPPPPHGLSIARHCRPRGLAILVLFKFRCQA
jgi:hypothetical protein